MPTAPGSFGNRESKAPRKYRGSRRTVIVTNFKKPSNIVPVIVFIIAIVPAVISAAEKIPIGAIFEQGTDEVQSAFKFALLNHNENVTGRRFELQAFVNVINTADAFKLSHLICNQFTRGVYSMLGAVSPDSFDTLHSYSNTFQMPFVTPWFPEKVLTPSSGFSDFAISMRPDYHRAIIDTVRYYGWKKIIYLYDSHDGTLVMLDNGFHDGWATPAIPKLQEPGGDLVVSDSEGAWIINFLHVGIAIGPFLALYLMEKIGRKWTLVISAVPKLVSWILIGFATIHWELYIARFLAGTGSGITLTVTPIYIGEVAKKSTRGPMGTTIAVMINVGTLVVYAIGLYVSRMTLALICVSVPVIFLLTFIWMPESPTYLVRTGRITDAEVVLKWSLAKENVEDELAEIKQYLCRGGGEIIEMNFMDNLREMVSRRGNRKAFRITIICFTGLMMSGNVPVLAYQIYIFQEAHVTLSTEFSIILAGISLVAAGWICVSLVKFTGKRMLLLISAPFTAFFLAAMALFFTLERFGVNVDQANWIPVVCMIGYVVFYALGLDSMAYAYQGEVFPDNVKGLSAMICALYYALLGILTVQLYQIMQDTYGVEAPLWFFSACTVVIWLLIYLIVPETEGKSLDEIKRELHEDKTTKQIMSRASSYIFS